MAERVIEIRGLRKTYGDVEAVKGIDLHVDRGEVFALLGPNGAGKTTTAEILEGFRPKTAGEVGVLGHDPAKREVALKQRIGIVLQSTGIDPFLTVRETVELYSGYFPHPRSVDEVIDLVGLAEKRTTRVNKLSGGSNGAWTSRSRSRETRSCSSWTSRPPGSTRTPGGTRGRS